MTGGFWKSDVEIPLSIWWVGVLRMQQHPLWVWTMPKIETPQASFFFVKFFFVHAVGRFECKAIRKRTTKTRMQLIQCCLQSSSSRCAVRMWCFEHSTRQEEFELFLPQLLLCNASFCWLEDNILDATYSKYENVWMDYAIVRNYWSYVLYLEWSTVLAMDPARSTGHTLRKRGWSFFCEKITFKKMIMPIN